MIKRYEEYIEHTKAGIRLPIVTTMENLSMRVSAGDGAVLKYGDKVLVTDCACGFVGAVYEFIDEPGKDFGYIECRLNLIDVAEDVFKDGGSAIAWAMQQ